MDYFKHYSTASDSKSLNRIFDKFGHKGIAFWWMLVELCCENWDGKSEPEFVFHQRTVATKLKSSPNSVRPWLELCSDLDMCAFAHFETQFEIKMPKLAEVKTSRNVIKSNKKQLTVYIEENRKEENRIELEGKKNLPEKNSKAKRKGLESSPLSTLFNPDDEIQSWLLTGTLPAQNELLTKFSHHVLAEEIKKAFFWQCENKPRNAGTFLLTWMSNKKTSAFMPNSVQKRFSGRGAGIEPNEQNPTGNPYIQEAIDKGLIA